MEKAKKVVCPDCGDSVETQGLDRRDFLKSAAAASVAAVGSTLWAVPRVLAAPKPDSKPETLVKTLYEKLTDNQKKEVCHDWDYKDTRGLLRTHVSNNWHINKRTIDSDFYTKEQRDIIFEIYKGIFNPDWHERLMKQLKDDTEGRAWGADQNIAIFGKPGTDKFEFVMTGRHLTCRADGNSESHVALGGPIFHGHAASGFNEKVGHPGNVFWHQALEANKVYKMLDGKQQEKAMINVARLPAPESSAVGFKGKDGKIAGIPVSELSKDQKEAVKKVLMSLIEPYRKEDQEEIQACLNKQGGLEACNLGFHKAGDLGDDGEWDNWRLEGPAFVWYFRGSPHVHIWINVADDASVKLNARG